MASHYIFLVLLIAMFHIQGGGTTVPKSILDGSIDFGMMVKYSGEQQFVLTNRTWSGLYCSSRISYEKRVQVHAARDFHNPATRSLRFPVTFLHAFGGADYFGMGSGEVYGDVARRSERDRPEFTYRHKFICGLGPVPDDAKTAIRPAIFGAGYNVTYAKRLDLVDLQFHPFFTPVYGNVLFTSKFFTHLNTRVLIMKQPVLPGAHFRPVNISYGTDCIIMNSQLCLCANLTSLQASDMNFAYLKRVLAGRSGRLGRPVIGQRILRPGRSLSCRWAEEKSDWSMALRSGNWKCCMFYTDQAHMFNETLRDRSTESSDQGNCNQCTKYRCDCRQTFPDCSTRE
jgi:hypothetical protein